MTTILVSVSIAKNTVRPLVVATKSVLVTDIRDCRKAKQVEGVINE